MLRRAFPPLRAPMVAAIDAAAIVAFSIAGVLSHQHALPVSHVAEDALPLLAGWFAAAAVFGLYRRQDLKAVLLTWIVGIPLGVFIRAAILGRLDEPRQLAFLVTTLVLSLVVILAARMIASAVRG